MPKQKSDPISPWFVAAEELGEYIGIRFGRQAPDCAHPDWEFLSHIEFDGIGGFAELLRRRGAHIDQLPQIKHPASPSPWSLIKLTPKLLAPQRRIEWGAINRGPRLSSSNTQPPPAVAWHVFDEATTTRIRRAARKTRVTINSVLLKNLTKGIRPFLKDQAAVVPWMVPVNLRGKVHRGRETENHTSYVGIKIKSYETVVDVHQKVYRALNRGEHWANWYGYDLGAVLTHGMRKSLIASGRCMSQWNLGSFSNLGDWDAERLIDSPGCQGAWLFAPPVLRCQLVGAGCVTFQNRLTLTIQAHPDLTTDPSVPQAWLQNWVKEIDFDLSSVLTEVPSQYVHPVVAA